MEPKGRVYIMRRTKRIGWMIWALSAVVLGAWGCAPVAKPAAAPGSAVGSPTAGSGSYQDDLMPAATPDPVPDPEAGQTAAPGDHLEAIGTITALEASSIGVDGVVYRLTSTTEVKGSLAVGSRVKLEYVINADGTRTVIEAKSSEFFDD
jgi:hypothetical protein